MEETPLRRQWFFFSPVLSRALVNPWHSAARWTKPGSWCGRTDARIQFVTHICGKSSMNWTWPDWKWRDLRPSSKPKEERVKEVLEACSSSWLKGIHYKTMICWCSRTNRNVGLPPPPATVKGTKGMISSCTSAPKEHCYGKICSNIVLTNVFLICTDYFCLFNSFGPMQIILLFVTYVQICLLLLYMLCSMIQKCL